MSNRLHGIAQASDRQATLHGVVFNILGSGAGGRLAAGTSVVTRELAARSPVVVRLDRTIQYSGTPAMNGQAAAYWILRFRGE